MDKNTANQLVKDTFNFPFNEDKFIQFSQNLLDEINIDSNSRWKDNNNLNLLIKEKVVRYKSIGLLEYKKNREKISVVIVELKNSSMIESLKSIHGEIARHLLNEQDLDAVLIAYFCEKYEDWRFSLVKIEYQRSITKSGKIRVLSNISPIKRFSYLVGKNEPNHTAQAQLAPLLYDENKNPSIQQLIDAFSVEQITKEFFEKYKSLAIELANSLETIVKKDAKVKLEFKNKNIKSIDFSKKLMGQIVFVYFIQKKGWMGIERNLEGDFKKWGTGAKNFLRKLYDKHYCEYDNFFDEVLEPLFYNDLASENTDNYSSNLKCKIPFLNGGLFEPLNGYNWQETDIKIDNIIFKKILDTFDQFNFTIQEEDPLEKEVAVDPEMLGRVFENLLDENIKKPFGTFYTPRSIVDFMCKESLSNYLYNKLQGNINITDLKIFVSLNDKSNIFPNIESKLNKYCLEIDEALKNIKICDPAVGSGAFPVGLMQLIVRIRHYLNKFIKNQYKRSNYHFKKHCIQENIYGVDIDPGAIEIAKLRLWLSLIVDEDNFDVIEPLPNLDYKIIQGNSLIEDYYGFKLTLDNISRKKEQITFENFEEEQQTLPLIEKLNERQKEFLNTSSPNKKKKLKYEVEHLIIEIFNEAIKANKNFNSSKVEKIKEDFKSIILNHSTKTFFPWKLYFMDVFKGNSGFDIVIANPPYVDVAAVNKFNWKDQLKKSYGWVDNLYNHFTHLAFNILKEGGLISYITSNTFLTLQTKYNMRETLLKNEIISLTPTPKAFSAMVDTCIFLVKKNKNQEDYDTIYNDLRNPKEINEKILESGVTYWEKILEPLFLNLLTNTNIKTINIKKFRNNIQKSFFSPTDQNKKVFEIIIPEISNLHKVWWEKIKSSREINKNKEQLKSYRENLKPKDLTLLGLVTEGGQGLATGNNGEFIGCLEGTHEAKKIIETRPKRLKLAFQNNEKLYQKFQKFKNCKTISDFRTSLNLLKEEEIRNIFSEIKKIINRDIFGQGYLYRVISKDEITSIENISKVEIIEGIDHQKSYVVYDKGDKAGNRWYLVSPYYICWSKKNVKWLTENSGKTGKGMPVLRNKQYYFNSGFCWSDVHTTYLKARLNNKGPYDVSSMTLFSLSNKVPDNYIISLINSKFISEFQQEFLNNTAHFQINDARKIPILVPNQDDINLINQIYNQFLDLKKKEFNNKENLEDKFLSLQKNLDKVVYNLYRI